MAELWIAPLIGLMHNCSISSKEHNAKWVMLIL
jgi:hypothetical protein